MAAATSGIRCIKFVLTTPYILIFSSVLKCSSRPVRVGLCCCVTFPRQPYTQRMEQRFNSVAVESRSSRFWRWLCVLNNISSVWGHNRRHFNSNGPNLMSHQVPRTTSFIIFFTRFSFVFCFPMTLYDVDYCCTTSWLFSHLIISF